MIVSDSTTLIILLNMKKIEFLSNLFTSVTIPVAVYGEISIKYHDKLPSFISVKKTTNTQMIDDLLMLLDRGESEAITLALELNQGLIIDEKKGRKIAKNQGIKIVGLLGILYLNIKKGHISQSDAKDFLEKAIKTGYRISDKLIKEMFDSI